MTAKKASDKIKKEIEKDKKNNGQFYKADYEKNLKKRKK